MRILVFAGFSKSLIHFRKELLSEMVVLGNTVIAIGPESGYEDQLKAIGVEFHQIEFDRLSLNPLSDIQLIVNLVKLMKIVKPDLYFGYTIKPVIYGSIAAYLSGIKKRYSMVTGLGSVFIEGKEKKKYVKSIVKMLYKVGFGFNDKVFFQNTDDIEDMVKMKLIKREKCIQVNGSGVNLDYYSLSELPKNDIFLFIGSLMRDKGIMQYLKASEMVKKKYPKAEFWIVGPKDSRISGISDETLNHYIEKEYIKYFGETDDVRPFLDKCRYYVLPSYREGTPRSVLEAMATGRPIITTDSPGCRETVKNGVNGFLVPIKNHVVLVEKMCWMIENPKEVSRMSKGSYEIVKNKYDVQGVNRQMLKYLKIIL
ncbi:MAG: glycosyltransferase family 4 protein [Vulcanibacillus sp.]